MIKNTGLYASLLCVVAAIALPAVADDTASANQGVVNGADASAFLGSGPVIDRQGMDKAAAREAAQAKLGPLPADEQTLTEKISQRIDDKNKKKKSGPVGNFFKGIWSAFSRTAEFVGFPVGPDDDDNEGKDDL